MSSLVMMHVRKLLLGMGSDRIYHTFNTKVTPNLKFVLAISNSFVSQRFNQNVCWKCGLERKNITKVFCEECNVIQNPHETKNYFKIFNLDEKFDIDQKVLRNKYRKLQSDLHPDKFSNRSEQEKAISANFSSLVNRAYTSLQIPLKRAEHLLELKGNTVGEEQTLADPEFLMKMMELNEEVEMATDSDKLKQLNIKNKNELEKIAICIDECFKNNDLQKAKEYVIKMKYYSSLGNRINNVLREIGVVD